MNKNGSPQNKVQKFMPPQGPQERVCVCVRERGGGGGRATLLIQLIQLILIGIQGQGKISQPSQYNITPDFVASMTEIFKNKFPFE